jgi:hypothetical protein
VLQDSTVQHMPHVHLVVLLISNLNRCVWCVRPSNFPSWKPEGVQGRGRGRWKGRGPHYTFLSSCWALEPYMRLLITPAPALQLGAKLEKP